jgi:hypothetical protein
MTAEIIPFRSHAETAKAEVDALKAALPFVKKRKRGQRGSFWSVTSSGSYWSDVEEGKRYAQLFLPMLKYNLGPAMLAWIVLDMIGAGNDEKSAGLVVGFFSEIGRYCAGGFALSSLLGKPVA